jgi:hypothetical protein
MHLGITVEHVRANDNFALRTAASNGYTEVLKLLFDKCPELNVQDVRAINNYALRTAAEKGHTEVVELLFDKCPELNVQDVRTRNNTAMRSVALMGHVELLAWLFNRFSTDMTDEELALCGKTKADVVAEPESVACWVLRNATTDADIAWFGTRDEALACPLLKKHASFVVVRGERPTRDVTYALRWCVNDAVFVEGLATLDDLCKVRAPRGPLARVRAVQGACVSVQRYATFPCRNNKRHVAPLAIRAVL